MKQVDPYADPFGSVLLWSDTAITTLQDGLLSRGIHVNTGQWQSQSHVEATKTIELPFVDIYYDVPELVTLLQFQVKPNLPWAEEHFQERVSGIPHNPPPSHVRWPFNRNANDEHMAQGKFSHTYPERLWAGGEGGTCMDEGVGAEYFATLLDLVALLRREPMTRQAFIPIWWPVDGARAGKERVPCTIGYHFMIRYDMLHCHYYMRSCDLMRHLSDDLYMAARLMQWLCDALSDNHPHDLIPGTLKMAISSLHIFEADVQVIKFQRAQARHG
jgi:hypothetical protein